MHLVSRTKVSSCLFTLRAVAALSSGSVQGHKGGKENAGFAVEQKSAASSEQPSGPDL